MRYTITISCMAVCIPRLIRSWCVHVSLHVYQSINDLCTHAARGGQFVHVRSLPGLLSLCLWTDLGHWFDVIFTVITFLYSTVMIHLWLIKRRHNKKRGKPEACELTTTISTPAGPEVFADRRIWHLINNYILFR